MERWIQSCRHELLDRTLIIWDRARPLYARREYECHHNRHHPHRGIANAQDALTVMHVPLAMATMGLVVWLPLRARRRA